MKRPRVQGFVIGVDEAGRGPLAGPVAVACLVDLQRGPVLEEIMPHVIDSKQVGEKERERIFTLIKRARAQGELDLAVSFVSAAVIDRIGITAACRLGVLRSLLKIRRRFNYRGSSQKMSPSSVELRLDGLLRAPKEYESQRTIIRGDETERVIALASIVAKVSRDRLMVRLSERYPDYGFDRHKGYGTKGHYAALRALGPTREHRLTFIDDAVNQSPMRIFRL